MTSFWRRKKEIAWNNYYFQLGQLMATIDENYSELVKKKNVIS